MRGGIVAGPHPGKTRQSRAPIPSHPGMLTFPMPHRVIWESKGTVWTKFSGVVTYTEVLDVTNALYSNPRSDDVEIAYWDFSDIDGFVVDPSDVEEMAHLDHAANRYLRPMKAAFIVCDPDLVALADQYIAQMNELGGSWQNRRFSCLEDAREWAAPAL